MAQKSYLVALLAVIFCTPAHAELQLQAYTGLNDNLDSDVTTHKGAVSDTRNIAWDGKSFDMPPYWGARVTYWWSDWGFGIDYTHAKAYGDINFSADPVYEKLEFTDGNNLVTANVFKRFNYAGFRPYVGIGAGIAIPHVEVTLDAFPGQRTFEYKIAGPATQIVAGGAYSLTEHLGIFAETRLSYARIDADLTGGGNIKTNIISPHVSIGLTYSLY